MSASPSFITEAFHKPPSAISCQFANLLIYYSLTKLISTCTHIYQEKENELERAVEDWKGVYWPSLDRVNVKEPLTKPQQSNKSPPKKPSISNEQCADEEFSFLQSML